MVLGAELVFLLPTANCPLPRTMTEDDRQARKQKIFRACMIGLMVGSGTFLALRYVARLGVDPSLIVGTGLGIAVGMFLLKQVDQG